MMGASIFVGRDRELAILAHSAARPASLVTLWGPGGAGKTRLAAEHARREEAAGARVAWTDLRAARTAGDLTAAVATALGVSLDARDDARAVVAAAASAQRALVVADDVDRLDDEARRALAAIASGGARVIVTARTPLAAIGEHAVEVGPLTEDDACALFNALAGDTEEATARAIVARVDALPLAIELAAARVPLLGARELAARLEERLDVLGGALREAIASSWELLDERDRSALAACATFEAPFDAALAEAVMDRAGAEALDTLDRLRKRALLHAGPPDERGRPLLRLLEAVRDFVRAEDATDHRARHAAAVVTRCAPLAEEVARGGAVPPELARRRRDLAAAARAHDAPDGARAALALATLALATGPLDEAVRAAEHPAGSELGGRLALARAEALRAAGRPADALAALAHAGEGPDALRVRAAIARALGDHETAASAAEGALARARSEGDRALEAACLGELGAILQSRGQLVRARAVHVEAIALHVALGTRRAEGVQRSYLAVATHRAGDPAAAIPLHQRALAIHREASHLRLIGAELLHLGFAHHELGEVGAARDALERARDTLARAGARGLEAFAHVLAARLDVDEGAHGDALVHLARAAERTPPGWSRLSATRLLVEGHLAMAGGDAEGARAAYEASLAASADVEVGFEALTPAYLALAEARLGRDGDSRLAQARARVASFENPNLAVALAILAGEAAGPDAARLPSSEVRRALAFAGTRRALRVTEDAARVALPDGRTIDLSRRKNVRLVLAALVEARRTRPGEPLSPEALVAAGWPGERMRAEAATKRLHTAIWTLRSLGLGDVLLTEGEGYRLDPAVVAVVVDEL